MVLLVGPDIIRSGSDQGHQVHIDMYGASSRLGLGHCHRSLSATATLSSWIEDRLEETVGQAQTCTISSTSTRGIASVRELELSDLSRLVLLPIACQNPERALFKGLRYSIHTQDGHSRS